MRIRLRHLAIALAALGACGERNASGEADAGAPAAQRAAEAAAAEALLDDVDVRVSTRLIPRELLFGDPKRSAARLSPDGSNLAWLEESGGVLNVAIAPLEALDRARVVTDAPGGVVAFEWLRNNTHIAFIERDGGVGRQHVRTVNVITGQVLALAPGGPDALSQIAEVSWDHPDEIVIAANDRDPDHYDLYRYNVVTGARDMLFENAEGFDRLYLDNNFNVRFADSDLPNGGRQFYLRAGDEWRLADPVEPEDAPNTRILGFDLTNSAWYLLSSRGRESTGLVRYDFTSGDREMVAGVAAADISDALFHPITYEADAVLVEGLTDDWLPLTARARAAFAVLDANLPGEYRIISRTIDDRLWVVLETAPDNPGVYHLYDRENGELRRLIVDRPALTHRPLAPMIPVNIPTRDGLALASYLTLPPGADANGDGAPERRSPLVIIPYVGPDSRARYGFDAIHQWLADRGYAALSVNVRGAAGFGKAFQAAGDGEVGGKTTEDLIDAASWALERDVAAPGAIATGGMWLSGYTALSSALEPDTPFACAIGYNPPFDLVGYGEIAPPIWSNIRSALRRRLGDDAEPATRARLAARSLGPRAEAFQAQILVVEGAPASGAQTSATRPAIEAALDAGVRATYLRLPGDTDGLSEARTRLAYHAVVEAFLYECLGGYLAPLGEELAEVDVETALGLEHVPALAEALSAR